MTAPSPFELAGDLDAPAIARLFHQTRDACRRGDLPRRLDLSRLGQTDSSVLALMLDWQSFARARDFSIEYASPPDNLRVLAGLSQVSELLGWETETSTTQGRN